MSTIVHFEIPANDVARAKFFYSSLFGWQMEKDQNSDYWLFRTTDEKGNTVTGGGLYQRQTSQQPILDYIGVPSVDETVKKVKALGGQVKQEKTAVPNMGYFAICQDTENNTFAIWEPTASAK